MNVKIKTVDDEKSGAKLGSCVIFYMKREEEKEDEIKCHKFLFAVR